MAGRFRFLATLAAVMLPLRVGAVWGWNVAFKD